MIVQDQVNRFVQSENPNSIGLAANWTTPRNASNIERAGNSFDNESDFGKPTGMPFDSSLNGLGEGFFDFDFDIKTLALLGVGGWVLLKMFKGSRIAGELNEREIYRNKVKRAKEEYRGRRKALKAKPFFAFA